MYVCTLVSPYIHTYVGLQDILIQNEELVSERNELAREMREMEGKLNELTE